MLCSLCKGRLWCGKSRCALLIKFYAAQQTASLGIELEGSSPPSVFIGRWSYPRVFIGPMLPPFHGDTTLLDAPERWVDKSIDEIVGMRFQLVRGKLLADVGAAALLDTGSAVPNSRMIGAIRELAMAANPIDAVAVFSKRPAGYFVGGDDIQPFGPSAPLQKLDLGSLKIDQQIENAHFDTDLSASEAVLRLYRKGVPVSRIQKAFSVGAFGLGRLRRFVPSRWSITAVDDIIGSALISQIKNYPLINEYRVYEHTQLDNRWVVLMLPTSWRYELIEAWYPGTLWNPSARIEIFSDHELYNGRKGYPQIGGCYFAARLAVSESLDRERRQAGVVVLREAHPGYIMPVGVWNVREAVRAAVAQQPARFATLAEALTQLTKSFSIPLSRWLAASAILT